MRGYAAEPAQFQPSSSEPEADGYRSRPRPRQARRASPRSPFAANWLSGQSLLGVTRERFPTTAFRFRRSCASVLV